MNKWELEVQSVRLNPLELTPDLAARLLAIFLTPEGQVASHGE